METEGIKAQYFKQQLEKGIRDIRRLNVLSLLRAYIKKGMTE